MTSALISTFAPFPLDIQSAEDVWLIAKDGRRYLDLYGGHCVTSLGHCHMGLLEAIHQQAQTVMFYSTALDLEVRERAAQALLNLAPTGFDGVFFANSGAEANENALKLAFSHTGRGVVVAVEGAFHGRTAAVDPLCYGPSRRHHFPRAPFEVRWVKFGDAQGIADTLADGDVACVIIEPVQSTAGCRVHPPEFVEALNLSASQTGTLVIADEVQGGLMRCLTNFSHQQVGVKADIITCAKGIGGGFPASAMLKGSHVAAKQPGLFGSTFGGGPLACAAIAYVCGVVSEPGFGANIRQTSAAVDALASIDGIRSLQGIGLLRGLNLGNRAKEIRDALLVRGILVGTSHDPEVLRLLPPLTLTGEHVAMLGQALRQIL